MLAARNGILRAKVLLAFLLVAMGDSALGRHSACRSRDLGAPYYYTDSLGEKNIHMSNGGACGVVTFLEASFVETHLDLWHCRCHRWSWVASASDTAR